MKKKIYFSVCLIGIYFSQLFAQGPNSGVKKFEPYMSQGYTVGLGTINYFGDLPSGFAAMRPAAIFGYSYPFTPKITGRFQIGYGQYSGADSLGGGLSNESRGIHFRSDLFQAEALMMYEPLRDKRGDFFEKTHLSPYFVYGLGLFYMNPKAKDTDGTWAELQPIGTEGQYLDADAGTFPKPYKKLQFQIPLGLGLSYYFYKNYFSLNAELMVHRTFTDYMDDVSAKFYPDPYLMNQYSPQAAYFSNPTGGIITDAKPRGNPDKMDFYIVPSLSVTYYIGY